MIRRILAFMVALVAVAVGQLALAQPSSAASCQWRGTGHGRYEYCSGVNSYFVGSEFTQGITIYYPDPVGGNRSIYLNGELADTEADGYCTRIWLKTTNSSWPGGNILKDPAWKVCGKGNSKVLGITADQRWTEEPGSKVEFLHCRDSAVGWVCKTFFTRTMPS